MYFKVIEIDFIEESGGEIQAYEFKWNPNAKVKRPNSFLKAYPESTFQIIHQGNFERFLMED
ncbi:hypothetical protein DN752_03790 [Echinicola strongylocentroti]|uniref:DUF4143 domain-containing protein n=1 Tax=Echinicola strongylocentroti TaxID=1795355 RepID=A0A2Z4IEI7_9BACT|nr:hypothetical protein DN752_03790 [Echinicola strongylocentroti]